MCLYGFIARSPRPWLQHLQVKMTAQRRQELAEIQAASGKQITKVKSKNGMRKVSGGKDLKSTQQYPSKFGDRVAKLHLEWKEPWVPSDLLPN